MNITLCVMGIIIIILALIKFYLEFFKYKKY